LILLVHVSYAQQTINMSGSVIDENNAAIPGVALHFSPDNQSVSSGPDGKFVIKGLTPGHILITAHYLGYEIYSDTVFLKKDKKNYVARMIPVAYDLGTVTISGDRAEISRRQETINIETVDSKFISKSLGGDVMKTLSRLPGISSIDIGSGQSKPVIRGLGFNRVVVAESGIKHEAQQWGADHGLEIDQFNISSVEVIKGPASLMYGSDAIGGVIRIEPFAVPADDGVRGGVILNGKTNNNLFGMSAHTAVKKNNRFLLLRLTGISHGDYRVPIDTVTYNTYDFILRNHYLRNTAGNELNVFAAGGFTGSWGTSKLSVANYYRKSGFYADAHGFEIRNSQIDYDASNRDIDLPFQDVNHLKVISNTTLVFDDHKMDIDLSFQKNLRKEFTEPVEHGYRPLPAGTLERAFNKSVVSGNVQMHHWFSDRHAMSSGINLEHQDNRIDGWGFIIPAFRRFTAGAFLYDRMNLSEQLTVNAGLRFDFGSISLDEYHDWYASPVFDDEGNLVDEAFAMRSPAITKSFANLSYSLGMNYSGNHFSAKLNLGKSFRMPDARELGADGVNYHLFREERGDSTLTSETAWQADASLEYIRGLSTIRLSGFYNWFPGYIYLNPTSDFSDETGLQVFHFVQNEVIRYGGEITFTQQVGDLLNLSAGGEYVYSEQRSGNKQGFGLAFSPPPSVLVGITWNPDVKSKTFSDIYLTLETRMAARQTRVVPPEEPTKGYQVLNFLAGTRIASRGQNFEIYFQLNNILDATYYNHTSYYRLINIPEPGRSGQLTLVWPF
jgi:iron complex outermembrane recepter protein